MKTQIKMTPQAIIFKTQGQAQIILPIKTAPKLYERLRKIKK